MNQNKRFFSIKEHLFLWFSGALTAFLIIGIFWVSMRNDLDAARMLAVKGNSVFEKANETFQLNKEAAQNLHSSVNAIIPEFKKQIYEELSAARELVQKTQSSYDKSVEVLEKVKNLLNEQLMRDDNLNQKIMTLSLKLDKLCAQMHCE